jgi:deoxyribonuclease IV
VRTGIHMPLKGGFQQNITRVKNLGCETVQLFPGNPTGWRMGAADPEELQNRSAFLEEQQIHPLVIHSAYLINLASISPDFQEKSKLLLKGTMERAALYRSPYVVLHTGNHGGRGVEPGIEQIIETISTELPGWPSSVKLLLENTAGSGTALGSRFEELSRILKAFPPDTLGICFDTAHGWAAGYDCGSKDGVEEMLEQFEKCIGLEYLQAVHINDSKAALGSRVDRHEHIGHGQIKLEGFKTFLNQKWPAHFPFILETPEIGTDWDRVNLETLRSLLDEAYS